MSDPVATIAITGDFARGAVANGFRPNQMVGMPVLQRTAVPVIARDEDDDEAPDNTRDQ